MPVIKCSSNPDKWKIGTGPCMYRSKASAERAYAAYRAQKHQNSEEDFKKYEALWDSFRREVKDE